MSEVTNKQQTISTNDFAEASSEQTINLDLRKLALFAGDIHGEFVQELTKRLKNFKEFGDTRKKRSQENLSQLRSLDLITDKEFTNLTEMFEIIHNVELNSLQAAENVREIYEYLKSVLTSPVALMIAGIIVDSAENQIKQSAEPGIVILGAILGKSGLALPPFAPLTIGLGAIAGGLGGAILYSAAEAL
jgi:hypothetical protein